MQKLGWLSATLLAGLLSGCTHCTEDLGPCRLVDVNSERGNYAGRNFYGYYEHELHQGYVKRYDWHPRGYHRFKDRDSWSE